MITVGPLREEEIEAYVALRQRMLVDSPWSFGSSPEDDARCSVVGLRQRLGSPDSAIIVGRRGTELVAAAGVVREEKIKRRHIAMVWGVFVAPDVRRAGVGRLVVAGAIQTAERWEGVEILELSVSENAPGARRLYESLGFVVWGHEPDALRTGGKSFGEFHMSRRVPRSR